MIQFGLRLHDAEKLPLEEQLKSGGNLSFLRRWIPFGVLLLCIGLLVGVEFAIDGKYFGLPVPVCYGIMIAVLAVIGWAGVAAARRYNEEP